MKVLRTASFKDSIMALPCYVIKAVCIFCFLKVKVKSEKVLDAQSCLTSCNPMVLSLPGSSVHRILQTRILE